MSVPSRWGHEEWLVSLYRSVEALSVGHLPHSASVVKRRAHYEGSVKGATDTYIKEWHRGSHGSYTRACRSDADKRKTLQVILEHEDGVDTEGVETMREG